MDEFKPHMNRIKNEISKSGYNLNHETSPIIWIKEDQKTVFAGTCDKMLEYFAKRKWIKNDF